ncbi:hypothetical protein DICPUDRAFT_76894 [Dictyostelium purpureum]|uniref:PIH1 domain-containing protein 1 n=1 Tax=Dictyostelium purpureum TaxID=5786 RepID=F0ZEZ0_DICPU|nr:uncharacterized protein DICPUDRAFT_76894 [Dictyostelium purpureum]EGC37514.1 hypothetical protein DICPUDRAFT_76894 [Dictyostelium purpureum]|eukprot:XP_003285988.1 hypothetical protein DICPUDRAFT_76894 [Dictyostelium purpureum]
MNSDNNNNNNNNLNNDFKLTEKNLKDLQKTFEDPTILSKLIEYYDEVEKLNKPDLDNKIEKDIKNIIKNKDNQNKNSNINIITDHPPPVNNNINNTNNTNNNNNNNNNNNKINNTNFVNTSGNVNNINSTNNVNNKNSKTKKVQSINGFCFKTCSNKNDKVYVMISHYPTIGTASLTEEQGWIIPYSLFELENQQSSYTSPYHKVYHTIFGTDTYNESTKVKSLNRLLIQTSIQAIFQKFKESLNIVTIKTSKKVFQKEFMVSIVDDKEIDNKIQYKEPEPKEIINDETNQIQPVFTIQNIGINNEHLDNPVIIPKFIEFNIKLPKINNLDDLIIEIEDNERLIVIEDNVNYYLNVLLKHHVEDEPIAQFNKKEKNLYLKLQVIDESHSHNHSHNHNHNHNHNQNQNQNQNQPPDDTNKIIKELDKLGLYSFNEKRNDLPDKNLTHIPKTIIYSEQKKNSKIEEIGGETQPFYILKQNFSNLILIIYEKEIDKNSIIINSIPEENSLNIIYKKINNNNENEINLNFYLSDFFNNNNNNGKNNNIGFPEENGIMLNTKTITFTEFSFVIELGKKKKSW